MKSVGKRILVVDDETVLAMDVEFILKEAGYGVVGPATNVAEGLDLIKKDRPDGAILDLTLSRGRSDEIADHLAAHNIPFIFLSGHTEKDLPAAHKKRPLIEKPFRETDLLTALDQMIDADAPVQ